ncbi:recombinase family protein [Nakamurella sp.]|uniref:recombinase family protein n=1 Tax=Nakamurella sp. TaxID=1869182 RepID=UPI003B3A6D0B
MPLAKDERYLVQRTAAYARMSKDSELGIERQLADIRSKATDLGWRIVAEFIDNDVSATAKRSRPQYEKMMLAARTGQIHAIICWDLDRLSRKPREIEDVIELAEVDGLQLASCGGLIDLATPQGRMIAGIKAQVARHEVDQLKRRMRRSLAQRAADGKPHARVPYGWTGDVVEGRRLGPDRLDPKAAAVIQETATRLLAGESLRSIVVDLNQRGVPAPHGGQWTTPPLRAIMLRESNAGRRVHLGQIVSEITARPPILDPGFHDRVVALLNDPKRRTNAGAPKRHLLSKLAICGKCGNTVTVNPGRPISHATPTKRGKSPGYACVTCFGVRRVQAPIDELVSELVIARLQQPDAAELLGQVTDREAIASTRMSLQALEARLLRAADDYADGVITAAQLARISNKLRPQIESLGRTLTDSFGRPELAAYAGPSAAAAWRSAPLDVKRSIVDVLMTITLHPVGPGRRRFDPSTVEIRWRESN